MVGLEQFEKVCTEKNMLKLALAKFPTYIFQDINQGIELQAGKIVPFIIEEGTRVYDKPMSTSINQVMVLLGNTQETSKPKEEKPKEDKPVNTDIKFVNQLSSVLSGNRIIVPHDIEELKQMPVFNRIMLFQRTPPQFIKYLDKAKNRPYVEGNIMKMEANIAFLFKISSKIDGWEKSNEGVACYGSIKVNIDGSDIVVSAVGVDTQVYKDGDRNKPMLTIPEMMKNACTDMKKKCLADMGFNNDVYRGDV